MKKILMAVFVVALAASVCFAADDAPKATEPLGAVVETGGVIVGKITSVVEKSFGGGKTENSLVLAEDSGKTKIIPLDNTVKFLDSTFDVITLKQLKKGDKVAVEVSKDASGQAKAMTVKKVK